MDPFKQIHIQFERIQNLAILAIKNRSELESAKLASTAAKT